MLTLRHVLYVLSASAIVVGGGFFVLPSRATVSRSIHISAPAARIFAIVGDLRRFNEFWAKADPDADIRYSYEGTESGLGQRLRWESDNPEIGSGVITILDYQPPKRVEFRSEAGRDRASTKFELSAATAATQVTWTYTIALTGIWERWSWLFHDRHIGQDFSKGLEKLRKVAEERATTP